MIWCNTRSNKWNVSDSEATSVYKKIRDNRKRYDFNKMKTVLSNGEEIQLAATFVGYDCKICNHEHIIFQKCPMEMVGICSKCDKGVPRHVHERNVSLGILEMICMVHGSRVKV